MLQSILNNFRHLSICVGLAFGGLMASVSVQAQIAPGNGVNSLAIGVTSTALGDNSTATGEMSNAVGLNTTANGQGSQAAGDYSTATGAGTFGVASDNGQSAAAFGYNRLIQDTANRRVIDSGGAGVTTTGQSAVRGGISFSW